MNGKHIGLIGALAFGAVVLGPTVASAADAETNRPTVMREGPGDDYRRITVIPPGRDVEVYRCTRRQMWCEVSWRRFDGWVRGSSLDANFRYAPPPIYIEPPDIYIGPGRHRPGWDHGPGRGPWPGDHGPGRPGDHGPGRPGDHGPGRPGDGNGMGGNPPPPPPGNGMGGNPPPGNGMGGQRPPRDGNRPPKGDMNGNPPQDGRPHRPPPCAPNDSSCNM